MHEFSFEVDADITRARTPPSKLYTDPIIYDLARERVFARSWQLVADFDDVRVPGQVRPLTLLEGCLNEPLVLTRDHDDRVHCLSNVCTHRGYLVCEHAGVQKSLRCRYHARRFALDGAFEHMPDFEQTANFPSESDNLPAAPLESWGRFWFASLAPSLNFDDWIAPVLQRVGWLPVHEYKFDAQRSRDYLVQCNWALYCENYLEGFHIPFVHPDLSEVVEYGSYRTELYEWGNVQIGLTKGAAPAFTPPADSPDAGREIAGYYFWLFPNLMLNFYPWGLSINIVKPLAVDRTRVSFLTYVGDASKLDAGAGAELDRVEREDESIVERVQQGVSSRLYDRGRYSPTREQGTHHFHRLLAAALRSPR
ncbi:MAG: aromatic ring-hydroxylating dioxygenase subunit alpha [Planctomycetota bacterium]|nr:MAG: aromatic ring-hydroxylating dioxygenase subunit alpha [Planctomycetota bacterium]